MRRTIPALEARRRLGGLLASVYYRGDEVILERAGKPMAVLVPLALYDAVNSLTETMTVQEALRLLTIEAESVTNGQVEELTAALFAFDRLADMTGPENARTLFDGTFVLYEPTKASRQRFANLIRGFESRGGGAIHPRADQLRLLSSL